MNKKNMGACIGIRHEDKYIMERRVALIPAHIEKIINEQNIVVCVQKSEKRIFKEEEYADKGAKIADSLKDCPVIFGVKEIPLDAFEKNKTYIFFSHVIKGQSYNMPMLKKMMGLKCNLIDYEKIEDETRKRLIFFGRFAGLAGMINTLWSLGQRYKEKGIKTPFEKLKQSHKYNSLEEARKDIAAAGMEIIKNGLPKEISPFITAITGYGNVSNGVQEIFSLLPVKEIAPEDIPNIATNNSLPNNVLFKTVFKEKDLSERKDGKEFELEDYYANPQLYKDKFAQYIPYLSCIVNGMYWDKRYPRIVTKEYLKDLYSKGTPKLTVIGDITCDADGSVECTHKGTEIEDPVFVYNPLTQEPAMGFKGEGVLVMSVDILPSELPSEASEAFSTALRDFVPSIAKANYQANSFEGVNLPATIKRAMILHKGRLTPKYKYIEQYL